MAARRKIPDPAYFARRLGAFLREHHPLIEKTEGMVRERSRRAWVSAWDALQSGDSVRTALQKADSVLYKGLLFSGYDTLRCVFAAEFPEVPESERHECVVRLLPLCKETFMRYDLGDGLLASPEYNHLILDLIKAVRRHIGECLY